MHIQGEQLSPWTEPKYERVQTNRPLGLDSLPTRHVARVTRDGFRLNLMLVGDAGLGKSTFVNTLFRNHLIENDTMTPVQRREAQLRENAFDLVEDDVRLHLSVIDTPGFGLTDDRASSVQVLVDYIDKQHRYVISEEEKSSRSLNLPDGRVHALLYFVPPLGHSLRELDLAVLKAVHRKTNVILIIAKADTMTKQEITDYKSRVMASIKQHDISIFSFDNHSGPFAVIGSETTHLVDGKAVLGRKYRWGVAEVENAEHCDFGQLRDYLLQTHSTELRRATEEVHYEAYRTELLESQGRKETILPADSDFQEKLARERANLAKHFEEESQRINAKYAKLIKEKDAEFTKNEELRNRERQNILAAIEEENKAIAAELESLNAQTAELMASEEHKKGKGGLRAALSGRSKK